MHISPIINNTTSINNINCKNYTSFTSKRVPFIHLKEDIVEDRINALNTARTIKKDATQERRKAEATIDFDCCSGFPKECSKKGDTVKEYIDSKNTGELLLATYLKSHNKTVAFDVATLDVKSIKIDFKKAKSQTKYYFDEESLLLKKAIVGQKRTLSGKIKAKQVLIFDEHGNLEKYYENAILSPQKEKVQEAKKTIDFSSQNS